MGNFELTELVNSPRGPLTISAEIILDWIDSRFDGKKIRILDVATGSGIFSYRAALRGHTVVATHQDRNILTEPNFALDSLQPHNMIFKKLLRDYFRQVNGITTRSLNIRPFDTDISDLKQFGRFDFVYCGQSTFHWHVTNPEPLWRSLQWFEFLGLVLNKFLSDNGVFFLTFPKPTYEKYPLLIRWLGLERDPSRFDLSEDATFEDALKLEVAKGFKVKFMKFIWPAYRSLRNLIKN